MGGPAKSLGIAFNRYDSVRFFSHAVPASIEQPTVYHIQSAVHVIGHVGVVHPRSHHHGQPGPDEALQRFLRGAIWSRMSHFPIDVRGERIFPGLTGSWT